MSQDQTKPYLPEEQPPPVPANGAEEPNCAAEKKAERTRRSFLSGTSKKALYLTPIIFSLTASQARADYTGAS